MPVKALKEIYLCKNTEELQKLVDYGLASKNSFLGYQKWLSSAQKVSDEAKLKENEGDEEHAYILYMRACNAFESSRKARDYNEKKDKTHWLAMGGKNYVLALKNAERLFQSLQRRYELSAELEKATKNEALLEKENIAPIGVKKVAVSESTTKNGPGKNSLPIYGIVDGNASDNSAERIFLSPFEVYEKIRQKPSSILVLDLRSAEAFNACRMKSVECISIPQSEYKNTYTALKIEAHLPVGVRQTFRSRHKYECIVLVDDSSGPASATLQKGQYLRQIRDAIDAYDNKPLRQEPLILSGGFDAWLLQFPSLTTNPSYQRSPDVENMDFSNDQAGSWSYPAFEDFMAPAKVVKPPSPPPVQTARPSMPTIPDRSTKPVFSKNVPKIEDSAMDAGDYVQLQFKPGDAYAPSNAVVKQDETQHLFDTAVSKHIEMRDALASIGQRLGQVKDEGVPKPHPIDNEEERENLRVRLDEALRKVEEKEQEIRRLHDIARMRASKPSLQNSQNGPQMTSEQALTKIDHLSNEVDTLVRKIEDVDYQDANISQRLDYVRRLREERKLKEKQLVENRNENGAVHEMKLSPNVDLAENASENGGGMRRAQSTPNINKMIEDEENEETIKVKLVSNNATIPTSPQAVPVPDRRSKPTGSTEGQLQQQDLLELDYYSKNVRNLQGPERRVPPGLTGLRNLGNTCYMNSVVQCLSNLSPFSSYFLNGHYRRAINQESTHGSKGDMARNFAVLLGGLWEGRMKYIIPTGFKQCVNRVTTKFRNFEQQDAQEFLIFLLECLHEDMNKVKYRTPVPEQNNDGLSDEEAAFRAWQNYLRVHSSFIVDLFYGQFKSTVRCCVCRHDSRTFDTFTMLTLPIPSDRKCRLEDCVAKYLEPENVTFSCSRCRQRRDAVKQMDIWKLPKILVIHLNRFSFNGRWHEKMQTFVDFPTNHLDMQPFCQGPTSTYTLIGVTNHYGTMEGGHYTAYCRSINDGRWYKFEDQEVTSISQGSVKTAAAYILYYVAEDVISVK